jgi:light-regulated signal transduction histidine kinase (bacteriophytochrome)
VVSPSQSTPAFGEANLSNCEREQIQLAGSIQPHGALLVVDDPNRTVAQASANAAEFLGVSDGLIGRSLRELDGDLFDLVGRQRAQSLRTIPIGVRCRIGSPPTEFDGLIHQPLDGGLIVELERAGPPTDFSTSVEKALRRIVDASSLRVLSEETASIFKDLSGYDRVMVYRFDEAGHGQVFAERRNPNLEPYLGNWYPASDIPQIARRLYERNRVRVLVDVNYRPVPIVPRLSPTRGRDLDMSLCFLRSMSPIHIQYLKNMGVAATLVVSLVVGGKLWGLIACHHYEARFVHLETRAICEVLAEAIATRIAALESFAQAQAELSVRRLEQRLIESISLAGDWRGALFDNPQSLLQPLGASGAVLMLEGQLLTAGDVPGTQELRQVSAWLDRRPTSALFATASLGIEEPALAPLAAVACGLIAVPVSSVPGEYLIWLRPERIRTITWGGDPKKPVIVGDDPSELSPRRSFAQWQQLVEGTSEPWTLGDVTAARLIGTTVADVVLQFRSMRLLIAEDQLEKVSGQVRVSDSPVIVADPKGRVLLLNHAFERLLSQEHRHIGAITDLPRYFSAPDDIRRHLDALVENRRPWRGEAQIDMGVGGIKPLLVRADPIYSSPERILGFVLIFTDMTETNAAAAARRRFQEGIVERHQAFSIGLDSRSDLVFRNLFAMIVENAQLAALEITDGVEAGRMPALLENVRESTTRTAEVLKLLVRHASRNGDTDLRPRPKSSPATR